MERDAARQDLVALQTKLDESQQNLTDVPQNLATAGQSKIMGKSKKKPTDELAQVNNNLVAAQKTINDAQTHLQVTDLTNLPDMGGKTLAEVLTANKRDDFVPVDDQDTLNQIIALTGERNALQKERDDLKLEKEALQTRPNITNQDLQARANITQTDYDAEKITINDEAREQQSKIADLERKLTS